MCSGVEVHMLCNIGPLAHLSYTRSSGSIHSEESAQKTIWLQHGVKALCGLK